MAFLWLRSSILAKMEAPPPLLVGKCTIVDVGLGTYCGYASILISIRMHEMMASLNRLDCHLLTMEINGEYTKIATEMICLSHM